MSLKSIFFSHGYTVDGRCHDTSRLRTGVQNNKVQGAETERSSLFNKLKLYLNKDFHKPEQLIDRLIKDFITNLKKMLKQIYVKHIYVTMR